MAWMCRKKSLPCECVASPLCLTLRVKVLDLASFSSSSSSTCPSLGSAYLFLLFLTFSYLFLPFPTFSPTSGRSIEQAGRRQEKVGKRVDKVGKGRENVCHLVPPACEPLPSRSRDDRCVGRPVGRRVGWPVGRQVGRWVVRGILGTRYWATGHWGTRAIGH